MSIRLEHGDCLDVMRRLIDEGVRVDSIVCDPPYGIGFMGKGWDAPDNIAFRPAVWQLALQLLKPGGHLLAFGATRSYHRMTCAIEDAGFEIRDCVIWGYGSGFPKSHNIAKAITAQELHGGSSPQNLRQARLGDDYQPTGQADYRKGRAFSADIAGDDRETELTEAARQWQGWGSALKPAFEPCVMARKPLDGTLAANTLKHGCGGLNIDGARIKSEDNSPAERAYRLLSSHGSAGDTSGRSPFSPRDFLQHIAFALRTYSTGGKVRAHSGLCSGDSPLGASECEQIATHLFPNGVWCGLPLSSAQDFQSDCLSCRRSNGEHTRLLEVACQGGPASLADALVHICSGQSEPAHSRDCQCSDRPSSLGDALLCVSFSALSKAYCTIYSSRPQSNIGRFPANLIHDGSPEVVALFPETGVSSGGKGEASLKSAGPHFETYGGGKRGDHLGANAGGLGDSGSAARFFYQVQPDPEGARLFYSAKADSSDRLGSKHPTVKPVDLIAYLQRLVTPPGGLTLDPFAGSGTAAMAAMREGFDAILIEREAEYVADIRRRIAHVRGEDSPLFAGAAE